MLMRKRKNKLVNSMVFALSVAVIMNALCIALVLFTRRYASIEPRIYSIFVAVSVGLIILLNILLLLGYGKPILWMRKAFVVVGTLFIIVSGVATYYVYRINTGFDGLVDTSNTETVQYSVITLDESIVNGVVTSDNTVGYVSGDDTFNTLLKEKLESVSGNATLVDYENYAVLLQDYLSEESTLDMVVVPAQYNRLAENMETYFQERLRGSSLVGTFNLSLESQSTDVKVLEEPFNILIMGVNENLADSIMIATVNPKTLTVTMSSLARDSLVPIACYANNSLDKLNHAHARSRQCLIDTVENYMDTDIDFFFEADFYALVKIVDALGGLELTSPITFTGTYPVENSNNFKDVTVREGTYTMTGEEVLTFARERHHFVTGDFERQLNQQYIIRELIYSIIDKAKTNPNVLVDVLDAAKSNIVMSLSMERDIAPLLGYVLTTIQSSPVDAMSTFTLNQTQVVGDTPWINGTSYITPWSGSVLEVRSLIKQTLGIEAVETSSTLAFSINEPYVGYEFSRYKHMHSGVMYSRYGNYEPNDQPSSGDTTDPDTSVDTPTPETPTTETFTVPDFNTDPAFGSLQDMQNWASNNGIDLNVNIITEGDASYKDYYEDGQVIYQSVDAGDHDSKPTSISISIIQAPSSGE